MTSDRPTNPITSIKATDEAISALALQLDSRAHKPGGYLVKSEILTWIAALLDILFPQTARGQTAPSDEIRAALSVSATKLRIALRGLTDDLGRSAATIVSAVAITKPHAEIDSAAQITASFFATLPEIYRQMKIDAEAIEQGDPAAQSVDEVIMAYPGFLAIAVYRIAHRLRELEVPLFPRILTEWAHERTGIDIHPGATLGHPVIIDHGTGIVIGETAMLGNNVKLYQGVTIGALSVTKALASIKRHPTIEDDVIIYANATILGGETVIGHGSVIGGGTWITSSVPPNAIVSQRSKVHVRQL